MRYNDPRTQASTDTDDEKYHGDKGGEDESETEIHAQELSEPLRTKTDPAEAADEYEEDGGASTAWIVRRRFPAYRSLPQLLHAELGIYGGNARDLDHLRAIRIAYARANASIAPDVRHSIYDALVKAVEESSLGPHSLFPVALLDQDRLLASRAAMDLCMLIPKQGGGPTSGMALIGSMLVEEIIENRGAVFGGMLCCGDRRAHPWLLTARDGLTHDEVDQFSQTTTGMLSAAAIEFVLDWMEKCQAHHSDHVFGALAAWMVNQVIASRMPMVSTGERVIPPGFVSHDEEYRRLAFVPLGDYVGTISSRLIAIARSEPQPGCMGHVLTVWGIR